MMRTFQDLIDDITLYGVFEGTEADDATMEACQEWLFDYPLCVQDDDAKFLRYFRRRFNNLYPRYLEQIRILTVKSNMDPFVTHYFERKADDLSLNSGAVSEDGSVTVNGTVSHGVTGTVTTTDRPNDSQTVIRTPNLTKAGTVTDITTDDTTRTPDLSDTSTRTDNLADSSTRTPNLNTITQRTDNLTETTRNTEEMDTERDTDNTTASTSRTQAEGSETSESQTKTNAFGIAYPEANINNIPTSPDTAPDIGYADTQSYTISKSEGETNTESDSTTTQNGTNNTDETIHSEGVKTGSKTNNGTQNTSETQQGSETTSGTHTGTQQTADRHTGTETTASEHNSNVTNRETETGQETTATSHTGTNVTVQDSSTEGSDVTDQSTDTTRSTSSSGTETFKGKTQEKGREESVADILPRAIKSIINTNELMWLIDSLKVCFDCYTCM